MHLTTKGPRPTVLSLARHEREIARWRQALHEERERTADMHRFAMRQHLRHHHDPHCRLCRRLWQEATRERHENDARP